MNISLSQIDVLILSGGEGTRLRPVVSGKPKVLADMGNNPFLKILIEHLTAQGFKRFILCVGYLKEQIIEYFKSNPILGVTVEFSEESEPLGTGGAIRKALKNFSGETAVILNGDTFFPVDYKKLIEKHYEHDADVSLCLKQVDDVSRYGGVLVDKSGRVISFKEKNSKEGSGVINGGTYVLKKNIFDDFDLPESFSIEKDFFGKYLGRIKIYGFVFSDYFVDVGTPESYKKIQNDFKAKLNQKT